MYAYMKHTLFKEIIFLTNMDLETSLDSTLETDFESLKKEISATIDRHAGRNFIKFLLKLPSYPRENDADKVNRFRETINQLPEIHREIMQFYFLRGDTNKKIAELLKKPIYTIDDLAHQGKNLIKILMDPSIKKKEKGLVDYLIHKTKLTNPLILHVANYFGHTFVDFKTFKKENNLVEGIGVDSFEKRFGIKPIKLRSNTCYIFEPEKASKKIEEIIRQFEEKYWTNDYLLRKFHVSSMKITDLNFRSDLVAEILIGPNGEQFFYDKKKNKRFVAYYSHKVDQNIHNYLKKIFWTPYKLKEKLDVSIDVVRRLAIEKNVLKGLIFRGTLYIDKDNRNNRNLIKTFKKGTNYKGEPTIPRFVKLIDLYDNLTITQIQRLYNHSEDACVFEYLIERWSENGTKRFDSSKESIKSIIEQRFYPFIERTADNFTKDKEKAEGLSNYTKENALHKIIAKIKFKDISNKKENIFTKTVEENIRQYMFSILSNNISYLTYS